MSKLDKLRQSASIDSHESKEPANRGRRRTGPAGMRLSDNAIRSDSVGASFRHHWILWAGPVVMLVAALFPWPYGYYNFLRFCICGAAAFLAYQQWTHDDAASKWVVMLVGIALLYNPFVPIYLNRETWTVLNVGTAIAFVGHYRSLSRLLRESVEKSPQIGRTPSRQTLIRGRKSRAFSLLSTVGRGIRVFKERDSGG